MIIDCLENSVHRLLELDLRRMENRVALFRLAQSHRRELEHIDAGELPAVRLGNRAQLFGALGKSHIQPALSELHTFEEKLQRKRRLAGAGLTVDQIEVILGQAAAEYLVEPLDPGLRA